MQLLNSLLVLTAALSVSAHPSLHQHNHIHDKRTPGTFVKAGRPDPSSTVNVDGNIKAAGVETPSATPTKTKSKESTPSATPTESSSNSGTGAKKAFCPPSSKSKRATTAQIMYTGNVGSTWGCNFMPIDNGDIDLYPYTMTFYASTSGFTCRCWNKIGPDGGLNGMFRNEAISVVLKKGEKKSIAVDADTQGGCACYPGEIPTCPNVGIWTGTWVEMDMGSKPNGGQSGADVSVLAVQDCNKEAGANQSFPGMRLKVNGKTCSWVTDNGKESYLAYINNNHDADGVGCTGYTEHNLDIWLGGDFPQDQ